MQGNRNTLLRKLKTIDIIPVIKLFIEDCEEKLID